MRILIRHLVDKGNKNRDLKIATIFQMDLEGEGGQTLIKEENSTTIIITILHFMEELLCKDHITNRETSLEPQLLLTTWHHLVVVVKGEEWWVKWEEGEWWGWGKEADQIQAKEEVEAIIQITITITITIIILMKEDKWEVDHLKNFSKNLSSKEINDHLEILSWDQCQGGLKEDPNKHSEGHSTTITSIAIAIITLLCPTQIRVVVTIAISTSLEAWEKENTCNMKEGEDLDHIKELVGPQWWEETFKEEEEGEEACIKWEKMNENVKGKGLKKLI